MSSAVDPESLRLELAAELRRTVGFDAYCWPTTDPATATAGLTVASCRSGPTCHSSSASGTAPTS